MKFTIALDRVSHMGTCSRTLGCNIQHILKIVGQLRPNKTSREGRHQQIAQLCTLDETTAWSNWVRKWKYDYWQPRQRRVRQDGLLLDLYATSSVRPRRLGTQLWRGCTGPSMKFWWLKAEWFLLATSGCEILVAMVNYKGQLVVNDRYVEASDYNSSVWQLRLAFFRVFL